ncbi:hypothetical protein NicSoilC12_38140 [Arthrobacter sp. NicSoilC12]|jgi:hypothetical protein|nr:hypothetical protein GCM10017547_20060 [Pseudarthrobacter oxydans]GIU58065.1 hypothetical protein NicSoilC12_38140 [Arthrobacter sp. NicSoilC12]
MLGWDLLERFVHVDVLIRTALGAGVPPMTALALLALAVAVAVFMAYTFQTLLYALLVPAASTYPPQGLEDQPKPGALSLLLSTPVGGTGPRAPGVTSRRPRERPNSAVEHR